MSVFLRRVALCRGRLLRFLQFLLDLRFGLFALARLLGLGGRARCATACGACQATAR